VVKPKDGPIRADELVSRIRRVLRNQPDYSYTIESVATIDERLKVDVGNRTVFIADEEIALTPTENKLLAILMRHPGRTLANDYLLRQIWPMEYANEERLHTHVYRLRKKIEQNPKEPHYIVSDWGRGYIFPAIANS
jgi:DNA-binding response OmpR family regulator